MKLSNNFGAFVNLVGCYALSKESLPLRRNAQFRATQTQRADITGDKEVALLQGKLDILQGVVKDLNERGKGQDSLVRSSEDEYDKATVALQILLDEANESSREQTEQVYALNNCLDRFREEHAESTAALLENNENLKAELRRSKKLLLERVTEFQNSQNMSASQQGEELERIKTITEDQIAQIRNEAERERLTLEQNHCVGLTENSAKTSRLEEIVANFEEEIPVLTSRLRDAAGREQAHQEQLKIATAAGKAAEKRREATAVGFQQCEINRKKLQFQVKLQQLVCDGLVKELARNTKEKEDLKVSLVAMSQARDGASKQSQSSHLRRLLKRLIKR